MTGPELRELRLRVAVPLVELARSLCLHRVSVWKIERRRRDVTDGAARRYLAALALAETSPKLIRERDAQRRQLRLPL